MLIASVIRYGILGLQSEALVEQWLVSEVGRRWPRVWTQFCLQRCTVFMAPPEADA